MAPRSPTFGLWSDFLIGQAETSSYPPSLTDSHASHTPTFLMSELV